MPSLVAFGRRWSIASDDFVFPSLTEAIVRLAWLSGACMIFAIKGWALCIQKYFLYYVFALLAVNTASIVACLAITVCSARGRILEPQKRHHIVPLLYIRLPLFLVELGVTCAITVLAYESPNLCNLVIVVRLVALLQWALILAVLFGIAIVFNPSGGNRIQPSFKNENQNWTIRFRIFSLGRNEAIRQALDDIAVLTASFFADVDLVASDILAGLLLLVHEPHQSSLSTNYVPEKIPSWMTLENARTMVKYATAMYGWEIYMLYNCKCGDWLKMCRKIECCRCCCRRNSVLVAGDNCCICATSTFLIVAKCQKSDVLFVSFKNNIYQVPFVVVADQPSKCIIIAIRGTASMVDAVNDLTLDDEAFSVDVDSDPILRNDKTLDEPDKEVRVHRGMLHSARYVLETLRSHGVLEAAMMTFPDFSINISGHSLGAGVATLLTLLLKQSYPNVRCYAFSSPGCVISQNGIKETEKHVFSIFVGDDIVPHRDSEANAVSVNDLFPLVFQNSLGALDDYDGVEPNSLVPRWRRNRVKLLPPGRLLHVSLIDKKQHKIRAKWVHHSALNEIKLSNAVINDHLPYHVLKVLQMQAIESL